MSEKETTDNNGNHVELSKELGLKEALGIAVGALIGGGVFSVLGLVINNSGPAAFLSFLLAGIVSSFTAFSYVRLALKYPKAGGAFIYVQEAFNKKWLSGTLGIVLWFGYSFSVSLYAMTFGRYLGEVIPIAEGVELFAGTSYAVSISAFIFQFISVLLFVGINLLGVKESTRAQNILVLTKVAILVLYIIVGITATQKSNFEGFFDKGFFPIVSSSVLIFVSMEGFEILSNSVEEMKNPKRDLPVGMFLSIIIVMVLYVAVAIVTVGVLGTKGVAGFKEVILSESASRFLGTAGIGIMVFAAIVSAASAINATLLGSSRLSYMLSHEGIIPKAMAKINHKTRVPARAIAISGILSIVFVLAFNIEIVALAASIIFMFIFGAVNLSGIKLLEGKKKIPSIIGVILIVLYLIVWIISFFELYPFSSLIF
ncbi:MAG: amino acid permease [Candidatus Heimdallarchaeota archaeon]|nr:amino acid permease [Candidatus Heimdallarchaeota archaeon]